MDCRPASRSVTRALNSRDRDDPFAGASHVALKAWPRLWLRCELGIEFRDRRATRLRTSRVSAGDSKSRVRPRAGSCSTTMRIIRRRCARRWPPREPRLASARRDFPAPSIYAACATCSTIFIDAFDAADVLYLTEVYPAGEEPIAERQVAPAVRGVARARPSRGSLPGRRDRTRRREIAGRFGGRRPDRHAGRGRRLQDRRRHFGGAGARRWPGASRRKPMSALEDRTESALRLRARSERRCWRSSPHFRIGGPADLLVAVENETELTAAMAAANRHGVPAFCLGAGTNLLVSDCGMRGLVVRLGDGFRISGSTDGR